MGDLNHDERNKFKLIARLARAEAEEKRSAAGWGGEYGDRGAGHLLSIVAAWEAGLGNKIPTELQKFINLAKANTDPEWHEYQRLKQKFKE